MKTIKELKEHYKLILESKWFSIIDMKVENKYLKVFWWRIKDMEIWEMNKAIKRAKRKNMLSWVELTAFKVDITNHFAYKPRSKLQSMPEWFTWVDWSSMISYL